MAVRLYLSSFRMGDHPEHLLALVGQASRRAMVIANAMDDAPADVRRAGVELELAALAGVGLEAVELDLRDYFGQLRRLRRALAGAGMAWLRGATCSCSATRSAAVAPTWCWVSWLPRTRWSTPDIAPGRACCRRACAALSLSTIRARERMGTPHSCASACLGWSANCRPDRTCRSACLPPGDGRGPEQSRGVRRPSHRQVADALVHAAPSVRRDIRQGRWSDEALLGALADLLLKISDSAAAEGQDDHQLQTPVQNRIATDRYLSALWRTTPSHFRRQEHVSAEEVCETLHNALPRKRHGRGSSTVMASRVLSAA